MDCGVCGRNGIGLRVSGGIISMIGTLGRRKRLNMCVHLTNAGPVSISGEEVASECWRDDGGSQARTGTEHTMK